MMMPDVLMMLMADPSRLDREALYELRNLVARYPYFQTARLLYVKCLYLLHDAAFGEELRKAALHAGDREMLFGIVEGIADFPIEKQSGDIGEGRHSLDRTLDLIDAFLETHADETISPGLMDISVDYTPYLLREEDAVEGEMLKMKGQELIDHFLEKDASEGVRLLWEQGDAHDMESDASLPSSLDEKFGEVDDENFFTETLAKIYVKQKRYSKALEIIKKLSLKYPKKNAYFADQIRFLEKLIINAKSE